MVNDTVSAPANGFATWSRNLRQTREPPLAFVRLVVPREEEQHVDEAGTDLRRRPGRVSEPVAVTEDVLLSVGQGAVAERLRRVP